MKNRYLLFILPLLYFSCTKNEDRPEPVVCPSFLYTFSHVEFFLSDGDEVVENDVTVGPEIIRNMTDQSVGFRRELSENVFESSLFIFDGDPNFVQTVFGENNSDIFIYMPSDVIGNSIVAAGEKAKLQISEEELIPYSNRSQSAVSGDIPPYTQSVHTKVLHTKDFHVSFRAVFIDVDSNTNTFLTGKWKGSRITGISSYEVIEPILQ